MIRAQELVPDYYIENSRDFQVLCRLMDYAYNSVKYNIDTMPAITETKFTKDTILPLVGDKFGIYDKQSYSNRELLSALPGSLYYKGALKSISILLNAYLDSLNIFDYALAYHAKDKKSAQEISEILSRDVKPYSIVIVLSIAPSLVELHVLDEYLKMVLPCGMLVDYVFGIQKHILDKFKYNENVFIFYDKNDYTTMIASRANQYAITNVSPEYTRDIAFIQEITSHTDINAVGIASVKDTAAATNPYVYEFKFTILSGYSSYWTFRFTDPTQLTEEQQQSFEFYWQPAGTKEQFASTAWTYYSNASNSYMSVRWTGFEFKPMKGDTLIARSPYNLPGTWVMSM